MIADKIKDALRRRLDTDSEWDYGLKKCWEEETTILAENIDLTVDFFMNVCTDEEFFWLSEVFEEVAEATKSKELISVLRKRLEKVKPETYDQKSFNSEHMRNWVDYNEYIRSVNLDIEYAEGRLDYLLNNDEEDK